MRIIMIGCEYVGKTTLAGKTVDWIVETMGRSSPICAWHDHFVLPFKDGEGPKAEAEAENIRSIIPSLLEKYSRYMIQYHFGFYGDDHHLVVNWYYADAVYAPLYYGYGGPGQYADRRQEARHWDAEVMAKAPDTVLVLVKASADVIRRRMRQNPHPRCMLKEADVEWVLNRFQEEYTNSLIRRRFTLDTTSASVEETLQEFLRLMEAHLTPADRLRILSHQAIMRASGE